MLINNKFININLHYILQIQPANMTGKQSGLMNPTLTQDNVIVSQWNSSLQIQTQL